MQSDFAYIPTILSGLLFSSMRIIPETYVLSACYADIKNKTKKPLALVMQHS